MPKAPDGPYSDERPFEGRQNMTRIFAMAALAAVTMLGATFAAGLYAQAAEIGAPAVAAETI